MLIDQISNDLKEAMKAKDELTLSTLRMLKTALKNKQIDLMRELTDAESMDVIKMQVKQLKDAIDQFESGGRSDLAEGNRKELEVLKKYLPAELPDEELEVIVKEAIALSGAASKADMGKAMGFVMKAVAGRADGSRVKSLVEKMLAVFVFGVLLNAMIVPSAHAAIQFLPPPPGSGPVDYLSFVELSVRFLRVLFLFLGLYSINEILRGSVEMTVTSRDGAKDKAEKKIKGGFRNTGVIMVLFFLTTIVLKQIG